MSPISVPHDAEKRRRALFDRAIQLPEEERRAYIERVTAGDPALRDAVLRLLAASRVDSRGVLDQPVYERPAKSAPTAIGAYKVVRRLGEGGMGTVYACREPGGHGLVAVKLLHAGLQSQHFLRRFEDERIIHSRLRHPNVCRILGGGVAEHGTPFIVMELVEGEPIDVFCNRHRWTAGQRLRLFSQVLAGVAYFHQQQIIHRDLKPSNILVTKAGKVGILDFGIAKIVEHPSGLTGHGPTRTKLPLMTVRYASPEQLRHLLSGRSSDIYSLGVVLYELLTGRHPFAAECKQGPTGLLAAMAAAPPALPSSMSALSHPLPSGADRMILQALRFDPGQRYSSAGQFLDDLRTCLEKL